jgi:putative transposase
MISLRQACLLFLISTSVYYYRPVRKEEDEIIMEELSALADLNKTWGFWLMFHRLRKLNFKWNHKRVYRVYTLMRLNLRNKRRKRIPVPVKEPLLRPIRPNVTWSIDFMHDTLECGRKIRSLNIIDDFNREVLRISIDSSMPATRVIREIKQVIDWRGCPERIRVDNGPEFIAHKLKEWAASSSIGITYIQPGKPTQNSLIERFNRTFRQEVLDSFLFKNLKDLRKFANAWIWIYNNERPHQGLNYLTPHEFLLKYGKPYVENVERFPTFQQDNDDKNQWKYLISNCS